MAAGTSSSYADRIGRAFEQQYGRPASADDPEYVAYIKTALPNAIASDRAAYERSKNRWNTVTKLAWGATAIPFAAAAPAVFGASGAAGASAAPAAAASTTGASGMTFGNLLELGKLGVGLGTNLIANKQQNRSMANDAAQRSNEFAQQMALIQQQNEEAKRQWEAQQAQQAQQWQIQMADRDRQLRLQDEKEARMAPRRAFAAQALSRLGDLLRLGGR